MINNYQNFLIETTKMKYLIQYEEYQLNEKVNWKDIKRYGKIVIICAILGYTFTPEKYTNKVYLKSMQRLFSYKINSFEDVELTEYMLKSIDNVILKVENSRNIENKKEVINRLKNVKVKQYKNTILFGDKNKMMYFFDIIHDKDFILLFDDINTQISFTHELNHLVDKHKKDIVDVNVSNFLTNVTEEKYLEYFKNWKKLNTVELKKILNHDYSLPDRNSVSIGELYYTIIKNEKSYYESQSEIYARLSSLKSFLVDKNYMDINDKIDKNIVNKLANNIKSIIDSNDEWSTEDISLFLSMFDFIIYLPIIDYDNIDNINLIAMNNDDRSIS